MGERIGVSRDDEGVRFHVEVTFAEQGGKTTVTMRLLLPSAEARDGAVAFGAVELGNQSLSRLEAYIAGR